MIMPEIVTMEELNKILLPYRTKIEELLIRVEDLENERAAVDLPNKQMLSMVEAAEIFGISVDAFRHNVESGFLELPFSIPDGYSKKEMVRKTDLMFFIAQHLGRPGKLITKAKAMQLLGLKRKAILPFKTVKFHQKMKFEFCLESEVENFMKRMAS